MVPREVVAVDRHYFQNTGAYDPLLSLWGSENLEMSFKVGPMSTADVVGISGAMYVALFQTDIGDKGVGKLYKVIAA